MVPAARQSPEPRGLPDPPLDGDGRDRAGDPARWLTVAGVVTTLTLSAVSVSCVRSAVDAAVAAALSPHRGVAATPVAPRPGPLAARPAAPNRAATRQTHAAGWSPLLTRHPRHTPTGR